MSQTNRSAVVPSSDPQVFLAMYRSCKTLTLLAFYIVAFGNLVGRSQAQIQGAGAALTGPRRPLPSPASAGSALTYVLQPGDIVVLNFRFTPEFNEEAIIGPDGHTMLKSAGNLQAAGLTVSELQEDVVKASAPKLVDPEVVITLKDFDKPHIVVAGEVNTPGRQDLRRPMTVLQAILASGGPKDDAAMGRVLLFRRLDADTAEVHVLQLAHYGARAREKNDMLLQPNDMILVRHDLPSQIERYIKLFNVGFYLNPLQSIGSF